ncbi:hypothetical protein P7K49_034734 [Saguinus oedipus]|uniref:Vomeronasal type-1 receptor n=1 Tax=Saguinus oedipus TaxID=9490 RepID=A0ABQ9TVK7_SAGOE|nr:hypothetical protein P7K49_034734 [Saguinus oedipus]
MLIYIRIILSLGANANFTIAGFGYYQVHCQINQDEHPHSMAFISVMVIRDLLFVVLMVWTSIYLVSLLHRRHRRVQHLHSSSLSSQPPPEIKAIHTILLLVPQANPESVPRNPLRLPQVISESVLYNPLQLPQLIPESMPHNPLRLPQVNPESVPRNPLRLPQVNPESVLHNQLQLPQLIPESVLCN